MSFLKNLQKNIKSHHFIALIGILVLALAIMQYSGRKGMVSDGFTDVPLNKPADIQMGGAYAARPAEPAGQNEVYSAVTGINTTSYGLPPSCSKGNVVDPSELLPKDVNSQWAQLNPAGGADFNNVNLLKAGYHIGIDTIGSSLRNANLQERSEPPNPTTKVGPWNNTTIEPDLMRTPLELGCGGQ